MKANVRPGLVGVATAIIASLGIAATRAYFVEPRELHQGWELRGHNT
jgi:hypothetical protein